MACFWLCSKQDQKPISDSVKIVQRKELLGSVNGEDAELSSDHGSRVMVVVDWSDEAKGALEWTLSHAVHSLDTIVLVHVLKRSKFRGFEFGNKVNYIKAYDLLFSMRNMCLKRRPEVQVEIALLEEGKERGPIIVEEAKKHKLSLLVLGQRKRPILRRLLNRWAKRRNRRRNQKKKKKKKTTCRATVEYCIQNSSCMTIAVRKNSKRIGGYLITTKLHKNFWLLA